LAWQHLPCFEKARKRADRNEDTTADHDVLQLSHLNEVADLTLGQTHARGKLLRGFEAFDFRAVRHLAVHACLDAQSIASVSGILIVFFCP
jgi:hypothetical protein